MRERLAKLACTSGKIRKGLLKKASRVGAALAKLKPTKTGLALTAGSAGMSGVAGHGAFHDHAKGFDPAYQALRTGLPPPGR